MKKIILNIFAIIILGLLSLKGVEAKKIRIPCPAPWIPIFKAPAILTTPYSSDFTHLHYGNSCVQSVGNISHANCPVKMTFRWEPPTKCCQVLKGKLILKVKALQKGYSHHDGKAGNDTIKIVKNGSTLYNHYIYDSSDFPFNKGYQKTISINITTQMTQGNRVSAYIEDDTGVKKAKLILRACCVKVK